MPAASNRATNAGGRRTKTFTKARITASATGMAGSPQSEEIVPRSEGLFSKHKQTRDCDVAINMTRPIVAC
jgi:hypothetical protein